MFSISCVCSLNVSGHVFFQDLCLSSDLDILLFFSSFFSIFHIFLCTFIILFYTSVRNALPAFGHFNASQVCDPFYNVAFW